MMNRQQRQQAWATACQRWLDRSFKALAAHALQMANGDRGVLLVSVDADEVTRALDAPPGTTTPMRLEPIWLPAKEFLRIIKAHHDDHDAWRRWGTVITAMEPTRDVALYLHNDPETDPDGYAFSRFLVTSVESETADTGDLSALSLFEQEQAFREAHATCVPDRLEYTIWLPHGVDEASVTVTCACGEKTTIPCTPHAARTTLASFKLNGIPVREINSPEGIQ